MVELRVVVSDELAEHARQGHTIPEHLVRADLDGHSGVRFESLV